MSEHLSEQAAGPAGHEYVVVDGLGGPWLAEVCDEYPELSPIGLIDDILAAPAVLGAVAALADDESRHMIRWIDDSHLVDVSDLRAVLAPVSSAVEGACICEPSDYARRDCPIHGDIPVAKHEQEVRAEWEVKVLNAFLNNPPKSDEACRYLPDFIASLTKTMIDARADALTDEADS